MKKAIGVMGSEPLPKPRVTLKVEGKPTQFLVDTGAQHSGLLQTDGPMSKKHHGYHWDQTVFIDYLKIS